MIIDGRIADIVTTGFLGGVLVIPEFVLQELQHIADSSDPTRRVRGRRGLDIIKKLQQEKLVEVRIDRQDFENLSDVDAKLVALALRLNAKIMTNDYNLSKVAEVQGIRVLNINQLANSLKPVVLPGEVLRLQILKEGSGSAFDPVLVDVFVGMSGSLLAEIGEAEDALLEGRLDGLIDRYFSADLGETGRLN